MKATDLKKGKTYTNTLDVKVPLMFTGKIVKQFDSILVYFNPIKTEENKNWFNPKVITKRFDFEFGNQYIK